MPQVASIELGRFVIAWRSTSQTTQGGIHYSIVDSYGATVGTPDRNANIAYSSSLQLNSVTKTATGFRITWIDTASNRSFRRDFNGVGVGITGEIRS